ncbi:MAG: hypothetical protein Q8R18_03940 [bacterium]|nr:hypothetical protein [bacterium]
MKYQKPELKELLLEFSIEKRLEGFVGAALETMARINELGFFPSGFVFQEDESLEDLCLHVYLKQGIDATKLPSKFRSEGGQEVYVFYDPYKPIVKAQKE